MNFITLKTTTLILYLILTSSLLMAQNQYSAEIIQPDPLYAPPPIGVVSVNSNNNIKILWYTLINDYTDYYKIYRESNDQANQWDSIGISPYSGSASFIDITALPDLQSYRYKLSSVDLCGNETILGDLHETINLSILKSGENTYSLAWNKYEGFEVGRYRIYRGTDKDNLTLIESLSSDNLNHIDTYSSEGDVYYQVEALSSSKTYSDGSELSLTNTSSYSNIVSSLSTNVEDPLNNQEIKIYPNPFNSKTNISFSNSNNQMYIMTIYDINGEKVYSTKTSENKIEFERNNLAKGIYFIELRNSNTIYRGKMLIIEL